MDASSNSFLFVAWRRSYGIELHADAVAEVTSTELSEHAQDAGQLAAMKAEAPSPLMDGKKRAR